MKRDKFHSMRSVVLILLLSNFVTEIGCTFSYFMPSETTTFSPNSNSIIDPEDNKLISNNMIEQGPEKKSTSNLGCFLCAQLLTVTKQRVGLSQAQLRIVLNDKCTQLPSVFRSQCFAFVSDSLPQIYVSLTYDVPVRQICEMLNLCDPRNPFINERLIEQTIQEYTRTAPPTTETPPTTQEPATMSTRSYPFIMTTKGAPPFIGGNELTTSSPFEERNRPFPPSNTGNPNVIPTRPELPEGSMIPDFKELASKTGGLPQPPAEKGSDGKKSKRLTCLFCERMLNNAKSYAISSKSEISAFANATCSKISEPELAEQCFQLTDRKINELAVFVDEQVVEALWCAQLNHC